MGLMVLRVGVHAVPATGEVDLSPNTASACLRRNAVELGGGTGKIEAQKGDRLLSVAAGVVGAQSWVPSDHPEVIRKSGDILRSGIIIEQIINNVATSKGAEGTVGPFEIQVRIPITGLVFCDGSGGTFT
jgi:hypothetical protein